jgi:hypothetical protein
MGRRALLLLLLLLLRPGARRPGSAASGAGMRVLRLNGLVRGDRPAGCSAATCSSGSRTGTG